MLGIVISSTSVGLPDVLALAFGAPAEQTAANVIWNIRLPRVLAALLAGAALAQAGALIQAALDNPLASPNVIGVNAGSHDQDLAARRDLTLPQKLAASAAGYVEYCEGRGFHDLVVSAKAHDVMTTERTYRQLSRDLPHIPLHIGITEAGTQFQGVIKSASGLGILLEEGIGDTMRISLTDDPVVEMRACWALQRAFGRGR